MVLLLGGGGWREGGSAPSSPHLMHRPLPAQDFCSCGMDWPSATFCRVTDSPRRVLSELLCLAHVSCVVVCGGVVRREHALARVIRRLGTRTGSQRFSLVGRSRDTQHQAPATASNSHTPRKEVTVRDSVIVGPQLPARAPFSISSSINPHEVTTYGCIHEKSRNLIEMTRLQTKNTTFYHI